MLLPDSAESNFSKTKLVVEHAGKRLKLKVWRTHLITFEFFHEKTFLQQKQQFLFPVFENV